LQTLTVISRSSISLKRTKAQWQSVLVPKSPSYLESFQENSHQQHAVNLTKVYIFCPLRSRGVCVVLLLAAWIKWTKSKIAVSATNYCYYSTLRQTRQPSGGGFIFSLSTCPIVLIKAALDGEFPRPKRVHDSLCSVGRYIASPARFGNKKTK
jgi:hypothetical protein